MAQVLLGNYNSAVSCSPCTAGPESAAPVKATAGAALDARGYAHGNRSPTWLKSGLSERLAALHAEALSFRKIAATLSAEFKIKLSRNACIGRAKRMHLPERAFIPLPKRERRPKADPVIKAVKKVKFMPVKGLRERKKKSLNLSLFDLCDDCCKWPYGHNPPFKFCGQPSVTGLSWCPEHAKLAYVASRWP